MRTRSQNLIRKDAPAELRTLNDRQFSFFDVLSFHFNMLSVAENAPRNKEAVGSNSAWSGLFPSLFLSIRYFTIGVTIIRSLKVVRL